MECGRPAVAAKRAARRRRGAALLFFVVLSAAKDLRMRNVRFFAVFAAQNDEQ
jgi:hypothetical protein